MLIDGSTNASASGIDRRPISLRAKQQSTARSMGAVLSSRGELFGRSEELKT
jgi:hypothetical protein